MRLKPIPRRPAFTLDCRNEKKSKLKEYNPLLDKHLRSFYMGFGIKGILLNNELVNTIVYLVTIQDN